MQQQRRCLLGMTNGLPIAVPVAPATAIIHTLPATTQSGEAQLDVVEMHVHNVDDTNPARVNVAFLLPSGAFVSLTYVVPVNSSVKIFNEEPFGGPLSGLGGTQIVLQLNAAAQLSATANAWGWFVRTRG